MRLGEESVTTYDGISAILMPKSEDLRDNSLLPR